MRLAIEAVGNGTEIPVTTATEALAQKELSPVVGRDNSPGIWHVEAKQNYKSTHRDADGR